jgi:hypothetical protein
MQSSFDLRIWLYSCAAAGRVRGGARPRAQELRRPPGVQDLQDREGLQVHQALPGPHHDNQGGGARQEGARPPRPPPLHLLRELRQPDVLHRAPDQRGLHLDHAGLLVGHRHHNDYWLRGRGAPHLARQDRRQRRPHPGHRLPGPAHDNHRGEVQYGLREGEGEEGCFVTLSALYITHVIHDTDYHV